MRVQQFKRNANPSMLKKTLCNYTLDKKKNYTPLCLAFDLGEGDIWGRDGFKFNSNFTKRQEKEGQAIQGDCETTEHKSDTRIGPRNK